jgi:hypothetical protein
MKNLLQGLVGSAVAIAIVIGGLWGMAKLSGIVIYIVMSDPLSREQVPTYNNLMRTACKRDSMRDIFTDEACAEIKR